MTIDRCNIIRNLIIKTQNFFTTCFWLIFVFASIVPNTLRAQNLSFTGNASAEALISNTMPQPFYFWTNTLGQLSALEKVNFFTHLSASAVYRLPKETQSFFAGANINLKQTLNITFNYPELYGGLLVKYVVITAGLFADSVRMCGLSPSNSNFLITQNTSRIPDCGLVPMVLFKSENKIFLWQHFTKKAC